LLAASLGASFEAQRLSFQNLFVGIHSDLLRLARQQHIHAAGAVADDSDLTEIDHAFAKVGKYRNRHGKVLVDLGGA
jgi:hypothetical protein